MKAIAKSIQAWRSRRKLRTLQWWEQTRARGKARFVFESALSYGFMVVGGTDAFESLFFHSAHSLSLFRLIFLVLGGIPIGLIGWSSMEAEYRKALDEAHIKTLASSTTTPHGQG